MVSALARRPEERKRPRRTFETQMRPDENRLRTYLAVSMTVTMIDTFAKQIRMFKNMTKCICSLNINHRVLVAVVVGALRLTYQHSRVNKSAKWSVHAAVYSFQWQSLRTSVPSHVPIICNAFSEGTSVESLAVTSIGRPINHVDLCICLTAIIFSFVLEHDDDEHIIRSLSSPLPHVNNKHEAKTRTIFQRHEEHEW